MSKVVSQAKIIPFKNPTEIVGGDVVVEQMKITPQDASGWLKHNRHNRPVSKSHVNFLAKQIAAGDWVFNGQPIIIANDDDVLDGQHRLMACIEAGIAIEALVIYGVAAEAFKTIDTGKPRTGSDVIALNYPKITAGLAKDAATACRYCILLESKTFMPNTRVSNTEILNYSLANPGVFKFCETLAAWCKDARPLSVACTAAIWFQIDKKHSRAAEVFMRRFYTGEDLKTTDIEYMLRQAFFRDMQRQGR